MGKLMENKSYFSKVYLCRLISVLIFHCLHDPQNYSGGFDSPHFSEVSAFSQIRKLR